MWYRLIPHRISRDLILSTGFDVVFVAKHRGGIYVESRDVAQSIVNIYGGVAIPDPDVGMEKIYSKYPTPIGVVYHIDSKPIEVVLCKAQLVMYDKSIFEVNQWIVKTLRGKSQKEQERLLSSAKNLLTTLSPLLGKNSFMKIMRVFEYPISVSLNDISTRDSGTKPSKAKNTSSKTSPKSGSG